MKSEDAARECIVFLSHQVENVGKHPWVEQYFNELLFSVAPFYKSQNGKGFRKLFDHRHRLVYDSGGFQFLMGRLKDPDPLRTVHIYKTMGYTKNDLLLQLDLPPSYHQAVSERRELIRRSAEFFHTMTQEVPVIPVVHGWTLEELQESLELIDDPDRLALGSYSGGCEYLTERSYTPWNKKAVGVGSYHATTKDDTSLVGLGAYSGACRDYEGPKHNHELDYQYLKKVGVGCYAAETHEPPRVGNQHKSTRKADMEKKKFTPVRVIFERLATALNLLRDREVFVLGAANLNMMHIAFLGGARYTDGSSWRIAARFWSIYLPEMTTISLGNRCNGGTRRFGTAEEKAFRELHSDPDYIFHDIPFRKLLAGLRAHKKDGFTLRALHNAWVVKKEEEIANEFTNDPERYYNYLTKRWEDTPYWRKRLRIFYSYVRESYVQCNLEVFLKSAVREVEG